MAARDQAEKRGRQSRLFARPTSIRPDLAPVEPSSARVSTLTISSRYYQDLADILMSRLRMTRRHL